MGILQALPNLLHTSYMQHLRPISKEPFLTPY